MKCRCYYMLCFMLVIGSHALCQNLPAFRTADWTNAGYKGNIPVYTIVKNILDFGGNGNGIAMNDVALQNAISSLNNQNGIVYFPAGTYFFSASISLKSGLVLKGEGATATTLLFNLSGNNNLINILGSSTSIISNLNEPAAKSAVAVSVNNAVLFAENDFIKIYQNDAALVNDNFALGSVGQILKIDSILNNEIYFTPALRRGYRLADAVRIKKLEMVTGVGIECLKIKRLDATVQQTANILFSNAANCWVKGVESDNCNFAHIQISESSNIEITNNYFHAAFAYSVGGKGYGISCEYTSGDCLIENNIFKKLRHAMLVQSGANGNVFAYNYSLEPFKTDTIPYDLSGDIALHGNYPYLNLFEGNIVQNIIIDASHGINGPYNTFFRNRAASYGIIISLGAGDSTNIIGNEITGTGFYKGNYYLQGNGNFEFGNNKIDSIFPVGSTLLIQKSFLYQGTTAFWNISSLWPSIGIPAILNSGSIPAFERYAVNNFTYCLQEIAAVYTFTGNGNWSSSANWFDNKIPPAILFPGSEIVIDPPLGQKCILNIPYFLNPGARLTIKPGKLFEVWANLTFVK